MIHSLAATLLLAVFPTAALAQTAALPPVAVQDETVDEGGKPNAQKDKAAGNLPLADGGNSQQGMPANSGDEQETDTEDDGFDWKETAAVVLAALGLLLVYKQLLAMQESNRQTQESNALTLKGLEESKQQAEAALAQSVHQAEASRTQSAADAAASLDVARKALEESRRTVEITQRARLVVEPDTFRIIADSSGQLTSAIVRIKNTGVLPATDVRHQVFLQEAENSAVLDEPMRIPPGPGMSWPRSVIGGGASAVIEPVGWVQAPRLPAIIRNYLFLHGQVQYDDGFGNDRTLRFCAYTDKHTHFTVGPMEWKPCHNHNWAD